MAAERDRRRATYPTDSGYSRPEVVDRDTLTVTAVGEDGEDLGTYRFADLGRRTSLLESLALGFGVAVSPAGRWRSPDSARFGASNLRSFYLAMRGRERPLSRIEQVTPGVWLDWRQGMLQRNRWPGALNNTRALLLDTPGLPDRTRLAMRRQNPKPKDRLYQSYDRPDFDAIQRAAWVVVQRAAKRIRAHRRELDRILDDAADSNLTERRRARQQALRALWETGRCDPQQAEALRGVALDGAEPYHALYLSGAEAYAFMILFAALRGYNGSTTMRLTAAHDRPDGDVGGPPVSLLDLDKRRRGSGRHSSENLVGGGARTAQSLHALALELTRSARETAEFLGSPSDRLLVFRLDLAWKAVPTPLQTPASMLRRWRTDVPDVLDRDEQPITVTLQQLRLTQQVLTPPPGAEQRQRQRGGLPGARCEGGG